MAHNNLRVKKRKKDKEVCRKGKERKRNFLGQISSFLVRLFDCDDPEKLGPGMVRGLICYRRSF
jgi:tRNA U34 2-thiouridine synthase MnmA/TrmU